MENQKFLNNLDLGSRHRKALSSLSFECSYDEGSFIVLAKIGANIGKKTMADLEEWELGSGLIKFDPQPD